MKKLLTLMLAVFLVGCTRGSNEEQISKQLDSLYVIYLGGDSDRARQSMKDAVELLEKLESNNKKAACHGLWLAYCRLAALDSKEGHRASMDANLLKARYWYLEKLERDGESTESALKKANAFDIEKCIGIVDKFDSANGGRKAPQSVQ